MDKILKEFIVNRDKIKIGQFPLCGKEIEQFADFSIRVTLATEAEIGQMRSLVGSLGWIARQCRPDLSYH
eukprot:1707640-Karenia_brevis.AAC.1